MPLRIRGVGSNLVIFGEWVQRNQTALIPDSIIKLLNSINYYLKYVNSFKLFFYSTIITYFSNKNSWVKDRWGFEPTGDFLCHWTAFKTACFDHLHTYPLTVALFGIRSHFLKPLTILFGILHRKPNFLVRQSHNLWANHSTSIVMKLR